MSIETTDDSDTHHEILERQRAVVKERLGRVLDALDRKRHAVTDVVSDVVSGSDASPGEDRNRTAIIIAGAALGGTLFVIASAIARRRRERRNPLFQLRTALARVGRPTPPSLFGRLAREAVGSILMTVVSEVGHVMARRLVDQRLAATHDEAHGEAHANVIAVEPVAVEPVVLARPVREVI